jgi:hypothetical protein
LPRCRLLTLDAGLRRCTASSVVMIVGLTEL